jgi:hypothetical protein
MTKCDFELIARVIRYEAVKARERKDISAIVTVSRIATHMAASLSDDHPRFDVDRFLIACGVES